MHGMCRAGMNRRGTAGLPTMQQNPMKHVASGRSMTTARTAGPQRACRRHVSTHGRRGEVVLPDSSCQPCTACAAFPQRACGMSPCMADTVKLFCRIFSVSQSTLRLVLQKMTACVGRGKKAGHQSRGRNPSASCLQPPTTFFSQANNSQQQKDHSEGTCVMVSVSYRSHSVSNFHSSRSTATKNCLMPCGDEENTTERECAQH